jgi:hypothetical protein
MKVFESEDALRIEKDLERQAQDEQIRIEHE